MEAKLSMVKGSYCLTSLVCLFSGIAQEIGNWLPSDYVNKLVAVRLESNFPLEVGVGWNQKM